MGQPWSRVEKGQAPREMWRYHFTSGPGQSSRTCSAATLWGLQQIELLLGWQLKLALSSVSHAHVTKPAFLELEPIYSHTVHPHERQVIMGCLASNCLAYMSIFPTRFIL